MSISRYIVVAVRRCSCARARLLAFNLLGDGIRDLDPKLSPAVLRLVTGAARSGPAHAGQPREVGAS